MDSTDKYSRDTNPLPHRHLQHDFPDINKVLPLFAAGIIMMAVMATSVFNVVEIRQLRQQIAFQFDTSSATLSDDVRVVKCNLDSLVERLKEVDLLLRESYVSMSGETDVTGDLVYVNIFLQRDIMDIVADLVDRARCDLGGSDIEHYFSSIRATERLIEAQYGQKPLLAVTRGIALLKGVPQYSVFNHLYIED